MSIFPLTPQHSNLFSKIFLPTLLAALLKSKKTAQTALPLSKLDTT